MPTIPSPLVTPYDLVADEAWEQIGLDPIFHDITTGLWQWATPDGVYSRIASVFGAYTSGPGSGGLTKLFLGFIIGNWVKGLAGTGTIVMDVGQHAPQSANATVEYLWAINAGDVFVQDAFSSVPLPELLWPPRTLISLFVQSHTNADVWTNAPVMVIDQFPWGSASLSRKINAPRPALLT